MFTLLIWFCCVVVKRESRGVVGTHMCTNHINSKRNELEILFYFKTKMGVLLITIQRNKRNEGNKSTQTNTNLDLHLLGIRGSIEILVPSRLRKAFDLGIGRLAKGIHRIPQLHPIYLRLGYALIHIVRRSRRAASCSQSEAMSLGSSSSSSSSESV